MFVCWFKGGELEVRKTIIKNMPYDWLPGSRLKEDSQIEILRNLLALFLQCIPEEDWKTRSFMDIHSNNGLFSNAALKLGAHPITWVSDNTSSSRTDKIAAPIDDVDPRTFCIMRGSILDELMLTKLPKVDIACAWLPKPQLDNILLFTRHSINRVMPGGTLILATADVRSNAGMDMIGSILKQHPLDVSFTLETKIGRPCTVFICRKWL